MPVKTTGRLPFDEDEWGFLPGAIPDDVAFVFEMLSAIQVELVLSGGSVIEVREWDSVVNAGDFELNDV